MVKVMDPFIHCTLDPSNLGSIHPWIYPALDPSYLGSIEPWIHQTLDLSTREPYRLSLEKGHVGYM